MNHNLIKQFFAPRDKNLHKKTCGTITTIGGNIGYRGALTMCSEAALRMGAGMVYALGHESQQPFFNINQPELICPLIKNAKDIKKYLINSDIIIIGPGLGRDEWAENIWHAFVNFLPDYNGIVIIDADGLYFLAQNNLPKKQAQIVLTPHAGEAKLLGIEHQNLAEKYNAICVLKGPNSQVISPNNQTYTNTTGNPGMATAGMGDVLSGMIAGLCTPPTTDNLFETVSSAVFLHGFLADQLVEKFGERSLCASDIISNIIYLEKLLDQYERQSTPPRKI